MEIKIDDAGKKLPEFREKHGKTLQTVSSNTGVAISTLIAIEKGEVKPHATTVFKINQYLSFFD